MILFCPPSTELLEDPDIVLFKPPTIELWLLLVVLIKLLSPPKIDDWQLPWILLHLPPPITFSVLIEYPFASVLAKPPPITPFSFLLQLFTPAPINVPSQEALLNRPPATAE